MRTAVVFLCFLAAVSCQTKNNNGNPTGEIGAPAFDEIVVESTLTVRGKPGSRSGKALVSKTTEKPAEEKKGEVNAEIKADVVKEVKAVAADGASVTLKRNKRVPRQRYGGFGPGKEYSPHGRYPGGGFDSFPSASSSASQASSNAFNSQSPFGNFGASASQSSSQSQNFGPHGFQGSAGQSASQTYHLPNGNQIDVAFSNGFSVGNGRPSFSNSQSITVTGPNGQKQQIYG